MSSGVSIIFLLENQKINKELVYKILEKGCFKYYPDENHHSGYFDEKKGDSIYTKSLKLAVKAIVSQGRGNFFALWRDDIAFVLHIGFQEKSGFLEIDLSIDRVYFRDFSREEKENYSKTINVILDIAKQLHVNLGCKHVFGDSIEDGLNILYDSKGNAVVLHEQLPLFWLNIFNPETVKKIGEEKILSYPFWNTEKLKDGSFLVVTTKNPFYPIEKRIKLKKEIEKHLGFKNLNL